MNDSYQENAVRAISRRSFLKLMGVAGVTAAMGGAFTGCSSNGADSKESESGSKADEPKTQTVTDMTGNQVEVPVNPTKYADGWFAHNEITIMLTGAEGLVATHCAPKDYQWMYRVCPSMSQATATFGNDFNFEDLAALEPQVIFDSTDDLRDKAAEVGIPLVNCMFKTFDEMKKSIELTAQVFGGDAPEIAKKYNAELEQVLADAKAKTDKLADSERVSVMHGNSVYTLTIDGTDTIIDDWIKAAGGKNAVTESTKGNASAKFTLEQVVAWNPDVIITGKADEVDKILNDPNWASINAVKNKKVFVNPKGVFGWDRYGVEELLQIQWAAATLHPELFSDLDINAKVKDFYKTYLNYELTDSDVELILAAKNPA
ncbi:ABC transporter substrate-binding protein [uncultured Senegalimassilia sp.]|uniref:ABC transporter substrate-binding protein n=1 Tax=uncultured Senegalimassilia sp. TaxID=1714350 RepID=UPI002606CD53|nr:ABC transporter substrate-binding protein [uncultured Senegalimassilia sp.]